MRQTSVVGIFSAVFAVSVAQYPAGGNSGGYGEANGDNNGGNNGGNYGANNGGNYGGGGGGGNYGGGGQTLGGGHAVLGGGSIALPNTFFPPTPIGYGNEQGYGYGNIFLLSNLLGGYDKAQAFMNRLFKNNSPKDGYDGGNGGGGNGNGGNYGGGDSSYGGNANQGYGNQGTDYGSNNNNNNNYGGGGGNDYQSRMGALPSAVSAVQEAPAVPSANAGLDQHFIDGPEDPAGYRR